MHSLVFRLDELLPGVNPTYVYGIAFYIVQAGCWLPLAWGIALMFYKGRRSLRKWGALFPVALFFLLGLYVAGYAARVPLAWESDFTMITATFTLLFFEFSIRSGMIPVNSKYNALFNRSTLGLLITDSSGAVVQASKAEAESLHDRDIIAAAINASPSPINTDGGSLLFAAPITGGYAVWREDITELNQLHKEMEEAVAKLQAANRLLAEEEKRKRSIQDEHEKARLNAQLENEILAHTVKLNAMTERLKDADDQPKEAARITLLLCYIKRRCNLFFTEKETAGFPSDTLSFYLEELKEIADYSDVKIIVNARAGLNISVRRATLLYDFFYAVCDWASTFESCRILAQLNDEDSGIVLRLLTSEDARLFAIEPALIAAIRNAGGVCVIKELDEDDAGISVSFPEGRADD
jgi:hypothetical protein